MWNILVCSVFLSHNFLNFREGEDLKYKSSGKKLTQPSTSDELKLDQQKKRFSLVALIYHVSLFNYLHI